jgi:hypothetical protein
MKHSLPGLSKESSTWYQSLFKPLNLYIVMIIYMAFYITTLYHRFIQIDENWFGEQAYWLANEGVVKLKSMPGILDFDMHMYLYHKLLVWLGAIIVQLTGWSVFHFKFITLGVYIFFFFILFRFYKNNKDWYSFQHFLLTAALIMMIPILLQQSFIFRPEIFVMTSGFVSYFFLDKYLSHNNIKWLVWAAFFSGITFLITLNALIFPVAGFILLLIKRKYKALFIFSLVCGAVAMLFTVDLWQKDHFQVFMYQLNHWPTRKFGETYFNYPGGFFISKLMNLLNEHQRFFWSERVMAFSALFLIAYFFNFNWLRKNHSSLFIYTTTLILALNLTGSHIAERYLIFYYPFMAIITALGMMNFKGNNIRYLKYVYIMLVIFNGITLVKQFRFVYKENENTALIGKEIFSKLPDRNAKVFAPWKFIYNSIGERNIISYQALQYYQEDLPQKMDQASFTLLLKDKYSVRYLILDSDITRDEENDYDWFRGGVSSENNHLHQLFTNRQYSVYEVM